MRYPHYTAGSPDFTDRQGVWVLAEQRDGKLSRVTLELLGQGQILSDQLGQELAAVLLGDQVSRLTKDLKQFGSQKVYLAEHKPLADYQTNPFTKIISESVLEYKPSIFLIGATSIGRGLAPRLAIRLGLGLTAGKPLTRSRLTPVLLSYSDMVALMPDHYRYLSLNSGGCSLALRVAIRIVLSS